MAKLEFGTAGIRGILGDGEDFLNKFHVMRVIEGYAKYLLKKYPNAKNQGVVIGRDNRHKSLEFAQISAAVLMKYGIKVIFSKNICPTPLVSYATIHSKAVGAVNVTASHNPKEHNGIKLYDPNGVQLLEEPIAEIVAFFLDYNLYLKQEFLFDDQNPLFHYLTNKMINDYINKLINLAGDDADFSNLTIVFSPQHGTGSFFAPQLFQALKVKAFYDEKQMLEDPDFTHTKSANPESLVAYETLIPLGQKYYADLLLTTDPDADRIGVGVWNGNEYIFLNGNETAILIFDYLLKNSKNLDNQYLIYSFVSTSLPAKMAKEKNVKVYETATGFKWIGSLINNLKLQNAKAEFLFAFEESYGSLIDANLAGDKDALQSLVILCKIASEYKKQNLNLINVLEKIYQKYGYVASKNISIDLDPKDPNLLNKIKEKFQKLDFPKATLINFDKGHGHVAPSDTLRWNFADGSWIALRPSGTEPKIKFYIFSLGSTLNEAKTLYDYFYTVIQKII